MNKLAEISLIVLAVLAVAIADVLTKKLAFHTNSFFTAVKNPIIVAVIFLYLIQILVFTYVFVKKAELGVVGIIQTALYSIIVIGSGIIFFKEKISPVQMFGMSLAVSGVIFMNL